MNTYSINAVRSHYQRHVQGHWFDPDTMRVFKSRLPRHAYGKAIDDAYFVTSEKGPTEIRRWSIRHYNGEKLDTIGKFQAYHSRSAANWALSKLIKG